MGVRQGHERIRGSVSVLLQDAAPARPWTGWVRLIASLIFYMLAAASLYILIRYRIGNFGIMTIMFWCLGYVVRRWRV